MKVYLDVCCLNRLFDDLSQPRVAREAAAIIRILELLDSSRLRDYSSEMAHFEIARMPDPIRRRKVTALLPPQSRIIPLTEEMIDQAKSPIMIKFGLADAVHLVAAQKIGVDVFLTVDDKLLKRAKILGVRTKFKVNDPMSFLKEIDNGDDL